MHFKLTYAGQLLAHRTDDRLPQRSLHVHKIRQDFHKQLKALWAQHPILARGYTTLPVLGSRTLNHSFMTGGFDFRAIATEANGLICELDVLLLRHGPPGRTVYDLDNRLKTIFDALRKANSPNELGAGTKNPALAPTEDERPFFVLLEDDKLITHVSVTSDMLLEPVDGVAPDEAVRLIIGVTVRPYNVTVDNVEFA